MQLALFQGSQGLIIEENGFILVWRKLNHQHDYKNKHWNIAKCLLLLENLVVVKNPISVCFIPAETGGTSDQVGSCFADKVAKMCIVKRPAGQALTPPPPP